MAGLALWRRVDGGAELAGVGRGWRRVCAGDEARVGYLLVGNGKDEHQEELGDEFDGERGKTRGGSSFPAAAGDVASRGGARASWREALALAKAVRGGSSALGTTRRRRGGPEGSSNGGQVRQKSKSGVARSAALCGGGRQC